VGVYSIVRVYTLVFGPDAGVAADIAGPWLLPLALATLALGALGTLAARGLRRLVAYLLIASIGTLLAPLALFTAPAIGAALYYLVHTTLVTAGLFLLADVIARQRTDAGDRLEQGAPTAQPALLGLVFFFGAIAVVGLPPLSGFVGKVLVLQATAAAEARFWIWTVVLGGTFLTLIALSRAGSVLFWKTAERAGGAGAPLPASLALLLPVLLLLGSSAALSAAARPVARYTDMVGAQLSAPAPYIEAVLGAAASRTAQAGENRP